ncbi:MAG: PQQ-binding-like beta-propeller repeat protein [Thermoplasmatota archaeon]
MTYREMPFMNRLSCFFSSMILIALVVIPGSAVVAGIDPVDDDHFGSTAVTRFQTRSSDPDSWPTYKGNLNHTGYSPTILPLEKDTKPLWVKQITGLKPSNTPVIHGNILYIGSGDGSVRGLNIDSGEVVWEVKATYKHINTPITVHGGSVYFAADDGYVYGYDISTKSRELFKYVNATTIWGAPIVADGKLYIGTMGKNLEGSTFNCLDLSTGNISWSFSMGPEINVYGFRGTPAYYDGRVYIGSGKGFLYCFDPEGFEDGNDGSYVSETNVSIGNADILWRYNASSSVVGSPLLAEGKVFFGNDIGRLFCLNALTGAEQWQKQVGAGEPPSFQTSPSYRDGILYVGAQRVYGQYNDVKGGSIWAIRLSDQEVLWRFNITGQMMYSSPVLTDNALVFGGGAGNTSVFCISTVNENIADEDRVFWYENLGTPINSAPAIASGRVFIARTDPGGGSGRVYAFGSPDPEVLSVSLSDPLPFIGEKVQVKAVIGNNATIGADIDIQFKLTTFNNSRQSVLNELEDVRVEAFSETEISADWIVEPGYDMIVAFITDVFPDDIDGTNNFGTVELTVNSMLSGYWTSAGGNPGKTGSAGNRLESNRTYWTRNLGSPWTGPIEDDFYTHPYGNGTISAVGGTIYMTTPDGSLMAMNTSSAGSGILWKYTNSSVRFYGRPLLLVDKDQTFGGSNKVFAYGDDGALWAFDWVGFWDGRNDGPFEAESNTGQTAGDVVWRIPLPGTPSQPMFISGGNVIVPMRLVLYAYDDDTGSQMWSRSIYEQIPPYAADVSTIFVAEGSDLRNIDPNTGKTDLLTNLEPVTDFTTVDFISYFEGSLLLVTNETLILMDAYPDDNGDGHIDVNDTDEGFFDNGSAHDIIWKTSLNAPVASPPAVSAEGGSICAPTTQGLEIIFLSNGTLMNKIQLPGISGRATSAGDSFYVQTGAGPYILRAYSPVETTSYGPTWTQEFNSLPRGEGAIARDHMYVSLSDGKVVSIGAANNPPIAKISSPQEDILLFPGEIVRLDASLSYDIEGDPLTYAWYLAGSGSPLYEGSEPAVELGIQGVGRTQLILRVFDDMRAVSEDRINITLLKRITGPDYTDFFYKIGIHMSFGISESSGAYFINSSVPDNLPEIEGAVFTTSLLFTPLPTYARYRFEWANVSINYADKVFPIDVHPEKMRMYRYDPDLEIWERAPVTGVNTTRGVVYGNFSDLPSTYYAIGILDNSIPEFRHRVSSTYVSNEGQKFKFRVEYRDMDGNIPKYVRLTVDNDTTYDLQLEGVQGNMTRYNFYFVDNVQLSAGLHFYYFEADDGFFIAHSQYYSIVAQNTAPDVNIIGPEGLVMVRKTVQFSAEGTVDPDGDPLTYYWDFDASDGIDRDKVGSVVSHVYYTAGVYRVTLTVTDGTTSVSKNMTVTVIGDSEDDGTSWVERYLPLILASIIAILIIAVVIFIVLSRKGHEEQHKMTRDLEEGWACPECGEKVRGGLDECAYCGYEYDPLDFENELDEM